MLVQCRPQQWHAAAGRSEILRIKTTAATREIKTMAATSCNLNRLQAQCGSGGVDYNTSCFGARLVEFKELLNSLIVVTAISL